MILTAYCTHCTQNIFSAEHVQVWWQRPPCMKIYLLMRLGLRNLTKRRRRGPASMGAMWHCALPSGPWGLTIMLTLGPYNTQHLLDLLNHLYGYVIQNEAGEPGWAEQLKYVVIWDNVSFHRAALVHNWFNDHPRFSNMFLPAYSPFLSPMEEFFFCMAVESVWSKPLWMGKPFASNGKGLSWHCYRVDSKADKTSRA